MDLFNRSRLMRSPMCFSEMKASAVALSTSTLLMVMTECAVSGLVSFATPSLRCIVTDCIVVRLLAWRFLAWPVA